MEMLSAFGGDKHEFCLLVIKVNVYSCPSLDINYTIMQ